MFNIDSCLLYSVPQGWNGCAPSRQKPKKKKFSSGSLETEKIRPVVLLVPDCGYILVYRVWPIAVQAYLRRARLNNSYAKPPSWMRKTGRGLGRTKRESKGEGDRLSLPTLPTLPTLPALFYLSAQLSRF